VAASTLVLGHRRVKAMTSTEMSPTPCPSCGVLLNAATSTFEEDATPSDGDITICLRCGHIMIFENNRPRDLTDVEMRMIAGDRRIIAVQKARGKVIK
jgi:RNase P subunit RPR2